MKPHALSVVVTGGTGPVGAAVARAVVRRGGRVLLVARNAEPLAALARELVPPDDLRYRVDALVTDIGTTHGCRAVLDAAAARNANALVNAPGLDAYANAAPLDARTAVALAGNTLAPVAQVTRMLLPHLRAQADARVLNIGPSFVRGAPADPEALRATQDSLRSLSEALRREVSGSLRVQFLGRRVTRRALDRSLAAANDADGPRNDQPDYIAQVAVQMLLAGTRERFLGIRGDVAGRLSAALVTLLDPGPRQRRA